MNNTEENKIIQAVDILFKMRKDGRMDEEEAVLLLEVIFSGQMDDETFNVIKFIYMVRNKKEFDGAWGPEEPLQVSPRSHYYD